MVGKELKARLSQAESLEQTKGILEDREDLDAERVWQEVENKRSAKAELLDLHELDAVSGGTECRDWVKDGCAATCEVNSWCWSNDRCAAFDVLYENFWATCPDGHQHEFNDCTCVRCGYYDPNHSWTPDDSK